MISPNVVFIHLFTCHLNDLLIFDFILIIYPIENSFNIVVISSTSSIWEDDHIEKLEKNQWKCLWCNAKFQGINATQSLAHVIGTKCGHIKRCIDSIDQDYLSRYKELHQIKAAKRGLLNSSSQKTIYSISRLQDMSSEVVESNIQRNSRDMYS